MKVKNMNRILVDGLYIVKNTRESIKVSGNSCIYILNNLSDIFLDILVSDESILTVYDYNSSRSSSNIIINQQNSSKVYYYHGISITDTYTLKYRANIKGNNNSNKLYIHGVSFNDCTIDADVCVLDKTIGNEVVEDIKILTINGNVVVLPKLSVNTLDVIANHFTAISNIRDDILFYLNSKGINRKSAENLIIDSYRYGLFKETDYYNNYLRK